MKDGRFTALKSAFEEKSDNKIDGLSIIKTICFALEYIA